MGDFVHSIRHFPKANGLLKFVGTDFSSIMSRIHIPVQKVAVMRM